MTSNTFCSWWLCVCAREHSHSRNPSKKEGLPLIVTWAASLLIERSHFIMSITLILLRRIFNDNEKIGMKQRGGGEPKNKQTNSRVHSLNIYHILGGYARIFMWLLFFSLSLFMKLASFRNRSLAQVESYSWCVFQRITLIVCNRLAIVTRGLRNRREILPAKWDSSPPTSFVRRYAFCYFYVLSIEKTFLLLLLLLFSESLLVANNAYTSHLSSLLM